MVEEVYKKIVKLNKERHRLIVQQDNINLKDFTVDQAIAITENFVGTIQEADEELKPLTRRYMFLMKERTLKKLNQYQKEYSKYEKAYNNMDGRRKKK